LRLHDCQDEPFPLHGKIVYIASTLDVVRLLSKILSKVCSSDANATDGPLVSLYMLYDQHLTSHGSRCSRETLSHNGRSKMWLQHLGSGRQRNGLVGRCVDGIVACLLDLASTRSLGMSTIADLIAMAATMVAGTMRWPKCRFL